MPKADTQPMTNLACTLKHIVQQHPNHTIISLPSSLAIELRIACMSLYSDISFIIFQYRRPTALSHASGLPFSAQHNPCGSRV